MSYVVSMKERKKVFSTGNVEFCGTVECKDVSVQSWPIASGPRTLVYSPFNCLMHLLFYEYFTE